MAQGLIPMVEALEMDPNGGLVVGQRLRDTYHGQKY